MATSKPRITVTLEPRTYEIVSRLARANGQSMSRVITDFLHVAEGQMERAVAILEAAAGASDQAKEGVRRTLQRAESALVPALLEALEQQQLDLADIAEESGLTPGELLEEKVRSQAAAGRRGAPVKGAGRKSPPVPVTRGVGTPRKAKKAAKKPQKGGGRA